MCVRVHALASHQSLLFMAENPNEFTTHEHTAATTSHRVYASAFCWVFGNKTRYLSCSFCVMNVELQSSNIGLQMVGGGYGGVGIDDSVSHLHASMEIHRRRFYALPFDMAHRRRLLLAFAVRRSPSAIGARASVCECASARVWVPRVCERALGAPFFRLICSAAASHERHSLDF